MVSQAGGSRSRVRVPATQFDHQLLTDGWHSLLQRRPCRPCRPCVCVCVCCRPRSRLYSVCGRAKRLLPLTLTVWLVAAAVVLLRQAGVLIHANTLTAAISSLLTSLEQQRQQQKETQRNAIY